jgi:hypothetical protein
MCAVFDKDSTDTHRFLIGTNSHKKENELHLIAYSEDSNRIDQEAIFSIDNGNSEILSLSSCPANPSLFACGLSETNSVKGVHKVGIYGMGEVLEPSKEFDKKKLKTKAELQGHISPVHSVLWEEETNMISKEIISADNDSVMIWDLPSLATKSQIKAS